MLVAKVVDLECGDENSKCCCDDSCSCFDNCSGVSSSCCVCNHRVFVGVLVCLMLGVCIGLLLAAFSGSLN
jgi:hypothetical protein